ncbi:MULTISPECIES: protein phosphatase 2C domain-containing protein [Streptomyces]|uniref:protein phosphatase 2C domain-containing protein n=3 Tax=Streptomyces TaxID=1883 RepID=UPI0008302738|nr:MULTISPECIES: protein phosphatase 2C domain-containing protein [unclassified Streptomyces]MDN5384568.1 protein phosphatase 2C domain-containing protein [Streptomyces sp. LB8]
MSQMHQQAAPSKCPSCAEPVESGDRFCGACGRALSTAAPVGGDTPTLTLNGASAPHPAGPGGHAGTVWPSAPQPDASAAPPRPQVPGTDAGGPPPPPTAPPLPPPVPPAPSAPPPPAPPPPLPASRPRQAAAQSPWQPPAQAPAQEPAQQARPAAPPHAPAAAPPQAQGRAHTAARPAQQAEPQPPPGGSPAPPSRGVRLARPAEPDEYPLQAPDPRVALDVAAQDEGATLCVACRAGRVDGDGYCENCGHAQPRERDHMEQESGPVAAVSDRGLRHHRNEDAFALGHTVLPDGSPAAVAIVCDGVSSATRPDDASLAASRAASESLLASLPRGTHPQQAMHEAIVAAAKAVEALAEEPATVREQAPHQNAPACTIVGALVTSALLVVGWVGDSRVYWVPADRTAPPARLTEDDSWAAQMVAAGLMTEAEAYADERAHAITGWLGADSYELEPHTASFKPDRPGVVVVCTDGLWNYAETAEEMAAAVPHDAAVRPLHGARVLVGRALDGGGHDNVTVAVLPFPAPPQGAGSS